ncbi:YceI family protein [Labilibacter sediminis]|nr:YceI family protein [Labilibacter sediminis]
MKKIISLAIIAALCTTVAYTQKHITKEGVIEIFSETSLFTIEAKNMKVASVLNAENGELVASTLVRSFKFKEALVEEHFNENYMESHKFPKAVFKGKINNFSDFKIQKDGTYPIEVVGSLTLHGETRDILEKGELIVKNGNISGLLTFDVSLANYKIEVEENYKDRIKDAIKLSVHFDYKPL